MTLRPHSMTIISLIFTCKLLKTTKANVTNNRLISHILDMLTVSTCKGGTVINKVNRVANSLLRTLTQGFSVPQSSIVEKIVKAKKKTSITTLA